MSSKATVREGKLPHHTIHIRHYAQAKRTKFAHLFIVTFCGLQRNNLFSFNQNEQNQPQMSKQQVE